MAVELVLQGGGRGGAWLRNKLLAVLREMGVKRESWTVRVVGDGEMTELHGRSLGIWGTTDVLTFDLREGVGRDMQVRGPRNKLGIELDTVVCVDEARRRALEMGHGVREELLLYCVHSLLHVRGFNDVTAAGAAAMHAREDAILVAVGVGAVYKKPRAGGRKRPADMGRRGSERGRG